MRMIRPYIPYEVRCMVAWRQLQGMVLEIATEPPAKPFGKWLAYALFVLFGDEPFDLDHDPALENREKVFSCNIHVGYVPAANDPEYLIYRLHDDHKVKTIVRGEHGQHSDVALARKRKRRERKNDPRRRRSKIAQPKNFRWPSRPFRSRV